MIFCDSIVIVDRILGILHSYVNKVCFRELSNFLKVS